MAELPGADAYQRIALQSSVLGASPYQLITLLFEGAHNALVKAQLLMKQGNIAARGAEISRAISIIDAGLRTALDHQRGAPVSRDLEQLYDYMVQRLLQANLDSDREALAHVDQLLRNIAAAWKQIAPH